MAQRASTLPPPSNFTPATLTRPCTWLPAAQSSTRFAACPGSLAQKLQADKWAGGQAFRQQTSGRAGRQSGSRGRGSSRAAGWVGEAGRPQQWSGMFWVGTHTTNDASRGLQRGACMLHNHLAANVQLQCTCFIRCDAHSIVCPLRIWPHPAANHAAATSYTSVTRVETTALRSEQHAALGATRKHDPAMLDVVHAPVLPVHA